jgi:hypothetical protein|tara:strand:- start:664 stop:891 length:228 start_codon:yes stop_codon:yes gene_type:complete
MPIILYNGRVLRNNTTKGNEMNSFDTQVHPEEMNFDQFTPEERAEFEAIQFEIELEAWETVRGEEEFWDNLLSAP